MNIAAIIDENLLPPHGNRQGLSYGQLAVLLLMNYQPKKPEAILQVLRYIIT
jgi:hypothetical protein